MDTILGTQTCVPGVQGPQGLENSRDVPPSEIRPLYALEGHEDEVYHELRVGGRATEPEYCAFLDQIWTFNRAMRWVQTPNGCLICCCEGGVLPLTGVHQVSRWFSDPVNGIEPDGDFLRFTQRSTRQRDCVVLPALQFDIFRHRRMELEVTEAAADWQFAVLIKGRSGPPMLDSGWQSGPSTQIFDLAAAWNRRGYDLRFAELHFVVGTYSGQAGAESGLRFRACLLAERLAVVPALPVIRTAATVAAGGLPVAAVVLDSEGKRMGTHQVRLIARADGKTIRMEEREGIWEGHFHGLPPGEYQVGIGGDGDVPAGITMTARVTDGRFYQYDPSRHSLVRGGHATGPLTGSYRGLALARNVGSSGERLVLGQQAWDEWDRSQPPGEHWHYWEALTAAELEEQFAYLGRCGWQVVHLCQHWGLWEKLDAGGHLAPHGAEQLALVMRIASRHGLAVLQALSHYPYGKGFTPPYQQTWEAGFQDEDWTDPRRPFTQRFHDYLREFSLLFREETGLFGMTTSGEGDIKAGPDRVNDTAAFVTAHDRNHLFLAEPIHRLGKLPAEHCAGWQPLLAGSRTYWIGEEIEPEIDLGIEFKFLQLGPYFMGEGCWPCPPLYARFTGKTGTWAGTARYRRRVRDSVYLGLIHRLPLILTWEEQQTEDERIVFDEVRRRVDWAQPFLTSAVAVRVASEHVLGEGRRLLAGYERFFSALPLAYRYCAASPAAAMSDDTVVFNAEDPVKRLAWTAAGGKLPEALRSLMPIRVTAGYRASYLWSEDRRTLLAYVYNSGDHFTVEAPGTLAGKIHRQPKPVEFNLALANLPPQPLEYRVYSLNQKKCLVSGRLEQSVAVPLGQTEDDYFVLVTPTG